MIDPLSATLALGAGSRLVDGVSNVLNGAASLVVGQPLDPMNISKSQAAGLVSKADFQANFADEWEMLMKKALAHYPQLKAQLGEGPYTMAQNEDGTLTISSKTTGKSAAIDPHTGPGRQIIACYGALVAGNVKNAEKGLELASL